MMASYSSIISAISENISTVVHIGAGYCTEYPLYQNLGIKQIVFVESDKQLFDVASERFSRSPDITILNRTIGGQNGVGTFFQTSNKRFSSLLKPNQILKYYPNLLVTNEQTITTTTLQSLCNEIQILANDKNLLVLELQGAELSVIIDTKAEVLQKFKWIVIRAGEGTLYGPESTDTTSEIEERLHSSNFDSLLFEEEIPPFHKYLFIRNDSAVANRSLKAKTKTLLTDFHALNAEHLKLHDQHSDLISENALNDQQNAVLVDKLSSTHTAQKEQLEKVSHAKTVQEKLATQRKAQVEQLISERDELAKLATERKVQLENAGQASAEFEKLATHRQAQVEQLIGERDEQAKLVTEQKAQLENAGQVSAEFEKLATHRQAQVEQLTGERDEQAKLSL